MIVIKLLLDVQTKRDLLVLPDGIIRHVPLESFVHPLEQRRRRYKPILVILPRVGPHRLAALLDRRIPKKTHFKKVNSFLS